MSKRHLTGELITKFLNLLFDPIIAINVCYYN